MGKIQMTEEQARQFAIDCFGGDAKDIEANVDSIREAGYIIKSAVEEAEIMFNYWEKSINQYPSNHIDSRELDLIIMLRKAIQELKQKEMENEM